MFGDGEKPFTNNQLAEGLSAQPPNILIKTLLNWQPNNLPSLVYRHPLDRFFECTIAQVLVDFNMRRTSCALTTFPLPTIYGVNPGDDVRTGSQLRIYHSFANLYRLLLIYRCNQDNKYLP